MVCEIFVIENSQHIASIYNKCLYLKLTKLEKGWRSTLLLGALLLCGFNSYAQFPDQGEFPDGRNELDTVPTTPLEQKSLNRLILPDTMVINYFHANDLSEVKQLFDTTLNNAYKYSPARRKLLPNAVTGILGGPTFPMFYEEVYRRGVDIGLHQYDLYHKTANDLKLPLTTSGYSAAKYTVGNTQADGYMQFEMGRQFANDIYFATELNRIFQNGDDWAHQNTGHFGTMVGGGFNKEDSPYKLFITYNSNVDQAEENGGIILVDSIPESNPSFREIPRTTTPATQHLNREIVIHQYLSFLGRSKDSLQKPREFTLAHQFKYGWADYKYADQTNFESTDSSFYQFFPVDLRGYRFHLEHNTVQNKLAVQTFQKKRNKKRSDFFEVGAEHQYHFINFEPDTLRQNNLFLFGKWKFQPSKLLSLNTFAHFGILDNAGDYRAEANVNFNLEKWGILKGQFVNQLYEPSVLQQRFNFNVTPLWKEDFQKTLSTSIKGTLELPKLGLLAGTNYHLLNNYVFYNDSLRAEQTATPISILQVFGRLNLNLGKIHLDNLAGIQLISEDFLQLPPFYWEGSIYFKDYIFKNKLGVKTGVEARFIGANKGMGFHPLIGQFYNQNDSEILPYPALNAFVIIKRKTFQFFLEVENAQGYFGGQYLIDTYDQRYYTEVVDYPYPNTALRWGITWKMYD